MNSVEVRLHAMCKNKKLAHGLLFSGPDLPQLLASAKSVAQNLMCESTENAPCNACLGCLKVLEANHPDVITIEPEKQETTVEQVRDLQLWIARGAYEAHYKVAILHKADTMNASAANSLLKTLEEPPPHAYLILTTTSPDSLLKTILSRLQQIRFTSPDDLAAQPKATEADWFEPFESLVARKTRATPEAVFELSEEVSKDKETLHIFFRTLEGKIKDELLKAQQSGASLAKLSFLDSIFNDVTRAERDLLQRYGNPNLMLDSVLMRWLTSEPKF